MDEIPTAQEPEKRPTKGVPFAWQSKAALRTIAEACDNRTDKAHVLAVYLALTLKSSDMENVSSFEASKRQIAAVAGVSYRKCADILNLLKRLGLIAISANAVEGTKEQGPNTYTISTVCRTPGTVCPRLGTDAEQTTLPRSDQNKRLEEPETNREQIAQAAFAAIADHASPNKSASASESVKKVRERNPLLDALASVNGSDPSQITGPSWGAVCRALKDIREVCPDLTPDEINRRAQNYHLQMPGAVITPSALAKHWATCASSVTAHEKSPTRRAESAPVRV